VAVVERSGVDTLRVNVGCGDYPLPGWLNIDADDQSGADVHWRVPPLPLEDNSVSEIYAGHFLEHLERPDAADFLDECWRALVSGGTLGIMVPDTREVMRRYVMSEPAPMEWPQGHHRDLRDLDALCEAIVFSTMQPSRHQWAYDQFTLTRALKAAGFINVVEFDRFSDPRVAVGAWYQFGLEAIRP
jgi:predicted SAM-dependent methyltransferase